MTTPNDQFTDFVDRYFDFAETLLTKQREFARQWVSTTADAFEGVTEQAQRATESVATSTVESTGAVVDDATETVVHAVDETPQAPYAT